MKISDLFQEKTVFSFEVFPPKKESGVETIYKTLEALKDLNPDFISVTYGAGGSGVANATTIDLCSKIKNEYHVETLRGDVNPDFEVEKDFKYASDLTEYILSKNMGFHVSGACYPEVHQEAENMIVDIKNLKKKVDAGAEHLISQLFFDNHAYYDFIDKVRIAGIDVPVEAGIMPVTNKKQIERMVSMCGASIPAKLSKVLQKFGDDPVAMRDAGISYAVDQIIDLVANGVDGVHIYTMNDPYVAKRITDSVASIVK